MGYEGISKKLRRAQIKQLQPPADGEGAYVNLTQDGQPAQYGQPEQHGQSVQQQNYTNNQTAAPSVVVSSAPQQVIVVQNVKREWSTPLCGCCADCCVCFAGFFFPWCYTCHLAQQMNEHCCVGCFTPGALIAMRAKIRANENIAGGICKDTCLYLYCHPCALTQLGREVKAIKAHGGNL